ncbi:MAG: hypothetical protein KTR28_07180 [Micavibrio sp.]|nr:hypothetical protein [Micavibrio sp.]
MDLKHHFNTQAIQERLNRLRIAREWYINGPPKPEHPLIYSVYTPSENESLPKDWEYIQHNFADIPVGCMRLHAKNDKPIAKIRFATGLKSTPNQYNAPIIRVMQKIGIEIDIIPLPDPGNQTGYEEDYKRILHEALVTNPLPSIYNNDRIPHMTILHSTSGTAALANMLDNGFEYLSSPEHCAGVFAIGTHISSPFRKNPALRAVYKAFCCYYNDRAFGEAGIDKTLFNLHRKIQTGLKTIRKASLDLARMHKLYKIDKSKGYQISKEDQDLSRALISPENTKTTHGQVHAAVLYGEGLLNDFKIRSTIENVPKSEIPICFIGGKSDFVSDNDKARQIAEILGAESYIFDAEHQPLLQSKKAVRFIVNAMQNMIDDWQPKQLMRNSIHIPSVTKGGREYYIWSAYEDPMTLNKLT